jgi:XapX domain-containing protein
MKPYLLSLAAGLIVGLFYSVLEVRSPAPPLVALMGLLGILVGEQALPIAKRMWADNQVVAYVPRNHEPARVEHPDKDDHA